MQHLLIYMMRCLLDLSDDSFAVILKWTRHDHEPSKMKVTLQSIATHLPNLCDNPETIRSVSDKFILQIRQYLNILSTMKQEPADD